VTEYRRDDTGRLVETVTHREPEFDREQVALLLAHVRAEKDIGSHGLPISETTSPNVGKPGHYTYEVLGPTRDAAAEKLERARKKYYEKWPDAPREADLWSVRRVDIPLPLTE
jgi:hypothetical protein